MTWFLDLRSASQGGPVGAVKLSDGTTFLDTPAGEKAFLSDVYGRDVLFATHGFENNRRQGTAKLEEWSKHLHTSPAQVFVGVLWPGDGVLHWGVDYLWEGSEAQASGKELGRYIDANLTTAKSISFVSHSLGARVMLEAIQELQVIQRVRGLLLMAGAIEDDALLVEFAVAASKIERIDILFSAQDQVLKKFYPAGNLLDRLIDRSSPNLKTALGRSGCKAPVPSAVQANYKMPTAWVFDHSDYLTEETVQGDFSIPFTLPEADAAIPTEPSPPIAPHDNLWKACWSAAMASNLWK